MRLIKSSKGSSVLASRIPRLTSFFILASRFLRWLRNHLLAKKNNNNCPTVRNQFIPRKSQKVLLVGPQNGLVLLGVGTPEDIVQVQDDILPPVADNDKETALLFLHNCQHLEHRSGLGGESLPERHFG